MTSRREGKLVQDFGSADRCLIHAVKYTAIAAGCAALAGTTLGAALPVVGALVVPSVPVGELLAFTGPRKNFLLICVIEQPPPLASPPP
jgi:hypothetical protein